MNDVKKLIQQCYLLNQNKHYSVKNKTKLI